MGQAVQRDGADPIGWMIYGMVEYLSMVTNGPALHLVTRECALAYRGLNSPRVI